MDTFFVCSGFHQPYSPNWGAHAKSCSAVRGWGRKGQLRARGYVVVQQERDLLQGQQVCLQSQPVRARCRLSFIFVDVRYNKHSSCRPPRKHSAALAGNQWYKERYHADPDFRARELERSRVEVQSNKEHYRQLWAAAYQRRKERAAAKALEGCFDASRVGQENPPLVSV
jgi:hypothetical protein